ncbi:NAD(P)-dependent oxidoreductase [Halanaerobacter jeridensis]|uniref:D-3-phosphoglycerate dehydrogenase n=1 Tax=Halanaerobacter jeridensis TaxID=706427 RepID=A0A938XSA5_9FIRM|nr:D-3-phosphoglycerate dehydrogenase [Halanaerobacter jeridensis]
MKIVILEPLSVTNVVIEDLASELKEKGHELVIYDNRPQEDEEIIKRIGDAEIAVITNLALSEEVITACPQLELISVAFTGVDHVDLEACRQQDITVCNAPGYSTHAVAELAMGLMITVMRNIVAGDAATRHEKTRAGLIGPELHGKTLGIIGTGSIGLRVAELGSAFGCKLLGYNRSQKKRAKELGVEYVDLETLMSKSDIVSLHLPHTEETEGLIDAEKIDLMQESSIFINTARGPIVDNAALANALQQGQIAGAGVDVFEMEPPIPKDHPLVNTSNAVLTPHVAFATPEAFQRRAKTVFANIKAWLNNKSQNVVF